MVYPRIFGQNKRLKRECLQIPSNVSKAHSLKWKKKKFFFSSYKNDYSVCEVF